jgi:hypothetical protein
MATAKTKTPKQEDTTMKSISTIDKKTPRSHTGRFIPHLIRWASFNILRRSRPALPGNGKK